MFSWHCLGVTLKGKDTLTVLTYQSKLTVFSRTVTKASRLYWTQEVKGNWSSWALIGGTSVSLKTDVAVAYNSFSKVHMYHIIIPAFKFNCWSGWPWSHFHAQSAQQTTLPVLCCRFWFMYIIHVSIIWDRILIQKNSSVQISKVNNIDYFVLWNT